MEDILLKLGFIKTTLGYELKNVIDNSIMCKIWQVEADKNNNCNVRQKEYIKKTLLKKPFIDFIRVTIKEDLLVVYSETYNTSQCTKSMPLSYFSPIFEELLKEKRDLKLNNLLK